MLIFEQQGVPPVLLTVAEFFTKNDGVGLDFDGYYGDQCVDSVQFFNRDVIGAPPLTGNASDVWNTYPQAFYQRVSNTPDGVPQLGDIMIWSGLLNGGPGHIAIFSSGDADGFTSFDQNWPEGSVCHFQTHDYSYVLGWLHPLAAGPTAPPTPPAKPKPQRMKVLKQCGLKPAARSGGPNVAMIPAGGQIIDSGERSGGWAKVQWTRFYGYIQASNIVPL